MRKSLPIFPKMTPSDIVMAMALLNEYGADKKDLELFVRYLNEKIYNIHSIVVGIEQAAEKDPTHPINTLVAEIGQRLRKALES
jgi:hypothetical protein